MHKYISGNTQLSTLSRIYRLDCRNPIMPFKFCEIYDNVPRRPWGYEDPAFMVEPKSPVYLDGL